MTMYEQWGEIRKNVYDAIDENSKPKAKQALEAMKKLNNEFMIIASKRYAKFFSG